MKIEKIKIEEIKPYENNAKLHPNEQVEQIKKSIQEFGNNDSIVDRWKQHDYRRTRALPYQKKWLTSQF